MSDQPVSAGGLELISARSIRVGRPVVRFALTPGDRPLVLEGEDVAVAFEQIRGKQKMSHFDEMRIAIDARYRGRTITRAEADELIGMINRCVPPEPEVPEAVKDLLDDGSYISDFGAELDR